VQTKHEVSFFVELLQNLRLAWRLLWNRRMPLWTKAVPLAAAIYLVWPADLLLDPVLGLGQLDDLALILLAARLFIALAPADLVAELSGRLPRVQEFDATAAPTVADVEGKTRLLTPDLLDR